MGSNTQQSTVLLKQQNALSSFKQSVSILNYCLTTFPQAPYNLHSITAKNRQRERKYSYPARSPVCTEELLLYSSGLSTQLWFVSNAAASPSFSSWSDSERISCFYPQSVFVLSSCGASPILQRENGIASYYKLQIETNL